MNRITFVALTLVAGSASCRAVDLVPVDLNLPPGFVAETMYAGVEETVPSTTSLMPAGLRNTLTVHEIYERLSLLANTNEQ